MFALSTLVLLFCVLSTVICYAWLYFFKPNTQRLPPGPSGLPFLGNLLSLEPELHTYFAALAQIHGPIYKLRLGSKLAIVIASPAVAREIFKDHDTVFANRDVPAAGRVATYGGFDIAWTPYGAEWRMLRKVCTVNMLSNTTLDSVYDLRRNEVRKTVSYLYSRAGSAVNVGEQGFLTVMNVITSMMWGGAVEGAERETLGAEFRELVAETTQLLGKPNVSDFFPRLARFDLQGVEKEMNVLVSRFDGIFEKMIGERVKVGEEKDGKKKERKDFLQFLLDLKDSEDVDSKTPFTMTHLKALLMHRVLRLHRQVLMGVTNDVRSSKCFCFLIRDRLVDLQFNIILFLFLSSITPADPPLNPNSEAETTLKMFHSTKPSKLTNTQSKYVDIRGTTNGCRPRIR
ncbi:Cytochrome P450 [Vigna angularis]|uniref:Cytochrome P450 n=1 Tax=Phaseolus angularis TaxID=3914 RepID=A0A8T0L8I6_PHAAN|nr:Cytochrome P450 [Vigna angularis]